MKILIVAPTPFFADRGTHIRILEQARTLEKRGHKITIATYHIGRDINTEIETQIDVRRIRRLLFWYKKLEAGPDWQKILLDMMLIRKVFFLARTQRPDVIHSHLHEGVLIGWIVQKLLFWRKIKLVADFHGSLTREMISHAYLKNGIFKNTFLLMERIINNLGDAAIASSWENSQEISAVRRDKKIETVPDGVNLEYHEKLPPKNEIKHELELPQDKIIVTYTGALVPNKGIYYLLQAIPMVLKETRNVFFVVAGFPMNWVRDYVRVHKLGSHVRLIYPLNYFDLPKVLGASDVGVDPKDSSTRQASGKILQYMAAGLPVVCFQRENNKAYLGEGACYNKDISAKGIAGGILYFVKNYHEIAARGVSNRERVLQFSWDQAAEKIENIYRGL